MRGRRHHAILRILDEHRVTSQDQLASLLGAEDRIDVTQATLSRDLRALGVVKEPTPTGGSRYRQVQPRLGRAAAARNLKQFLRDVVPAGNLLVLRTRIGCAQPVGLALDGLNLEGVVGTVAGDDTVLAVIADGKAPSGVADTIWNLVEQGG